MVYLSAGRTEAILVCTDAMPTETADLVSTGTWEEVDVINLQWFHTQWALHGVVLHVRAPGHPMIPRCRTGQLLQDSEGLCARLKQQ